MRPIALIAATICFSMICGSVHAEGAPPSMDDITAAYNAGDLEAARAGLSELVQVEPTPVAQFRYGRMLLEGMGGESDPDEGVRWIAQAAEAGHLGAMTYMGRVFLTAGPNRDPEAAVKYFTEAAARGANEAKYYLGLLHVSGDGVPQDLSLARTWLEAAALEGYGPAQFEMSRLENDPAEASRWLQEAAASDVAEAQFLVARELQTASGAIGDIVALYTRAAKAGFVPAQRALGTLYLKGAEGLEPDAKLSEFWLSRAVEGRDLVALVNLGLGYLSGDVLPADPEQAVDLLLIASDNGVQQASLALGRAYESEALGDPDTAEALKFYRLSAEQGSQKAAERLGVLVLEGSAELSVPPHDAVPWVMARLVAAEDDAALAWLEDKAKSGVRPALAALGQWALSEEGRETEAEAYLKEAAAAGHVPSQFTLGEAFTTGTLGTLDYVAAHSWLNIAATSGHERAAEMRDKITALMTPEDIAAAQDITRAFFEAARNVDPNAGAAAE